MSPARVFVAGATGVVGRLVVPQLVARGHRATAVGRTAEKRAALSALGATAIELDLLDTAAARRALEGHDVVLNLATHMPSSALAMMFPWAWRENDRSQRMTNAKLKSAGSWTPKWRSAREGLPAAIRALREFRGHDTQLAMPIQRARLAR